MPKKREHYIDIEAALNERVDKMFASEDEYCAALHRESAANTPELSNLKNFRFGKLSLALIVAEVMVHGKESDKKIIKGLYTTDEINRYIEFADKTLADKAAHVNADKVIRASRVHEPEDDLMYDNLSDDERNDKSETFSPSSPRMRGNS